MIRMIQSKAAGHAKAYFSDALAKSDYYISDQELAGRWQGQLAARLGLSGKVEKDGFFALCENLHPVTKEHLTPRTKEDRTVGYDINFHCPKSVSVLHVLSADDHILKAFEESVNATMKAIEGDSKTRVRQAGKYEDRESGELAWAHFVHQTARPVEGFSPDPHLHSHCFVFNATWDETEQRIKAGQFRDIKRDMPYYQAMFHKELSDRLVELGYKVRRTDKSFEIENVPQKVTALFSKRTDEIGRIAKEKGITDAKELGELGARTRAKKQKGASMHDLKRIWRDQIEALGKDDEKGEQIIRYDHNNSKTTLSPQQCIDYALLHCFERASVVHDRRLMETAFRHGIGNTSVGVQNIQTSLKGDKRIIQIQEKSRFLCTTKEVLAEEKRMVEFARQGQGKMIPLCESVPSLILQGQQAAAIEHVLTTSHRVSIIRGAAGTGKTTLMKEAIEKIEATGKQVTVLAPTAQASRGVLKQEGFALAETVAKFLMDKNMQEKINGQVLWIDEAGLIGTKDMLSLLEITAKNNARLILGGDTRQHASVVRGDALRILNTVAGIHSAEVSKNFRQKNLFYRDAVDDLSKGDVPSAFKKLNDMGAIKNSNDLQIHKDLVADYLTTIKKGKSALVIAPTHAQGETVTNEIRMHLREAGIIGKKEIIASRLNNLNLTEAQKSDHRNFKSKQIIQFNQNAPSFPRGSVWEVETITDKKVFATNSAGEKKVIPLKNGGSFDVYEQQEIALSKGDQIRITRNGFDSNKKRLNNGQILEVTAVSKSGKITLRNELSQANYILDKSFGHVAHAHCITSYASQGKSVDEVFISQPASTFPATDAKQFYVSVSRGRDMAHIYTDDKEALLQYASDLGERLSAIETVRKGKQKDFVEHLERRNRSFQTQKSSKFLNQQKEHHEPEI